MPRYNTVFESNEEIYGIIPKADDWVHYSAILKVKDGPLVVIYVSNLESAAIKIVEAGGRTTRDIFSFQGGRRFHFEDPIGNELAVWSDQ